MTKNTNEVIIDGVECKYKFIDKEKYKFQGKPYCTCFNEVCEDLSFACDKNCQIYEDYKQLQRLKKENEEFKNFVRHHMIDIGCEDWFEKFENRFQEWKADMIKNEAKYKKYLEEVKEIIKNHEKGDILTFPDMSLKENARGIIAQCNTAYVEILQKINEVL